MPAAIRKAIACVQFPLHTMALRIMAAPKADPLQVPMSVLTQIVVKFVGSVVQGKEQVGCHFEPRSQPDFTTCGNPLAFRDDVVVRVSGGVVQMCDKPTRRDRCRICGELSLAHSSCHADESPMPTISVVLFWFHTA